MQGTPKEPLGESSKAAVEVLNATKATFEFFNVDADVELKSALKALSNFD
jgi:glutaredoxin-related protein